MLSLIYAFTLNWGWGCGFAPAWGVAAGVLQCIFSRGDYAICAAQWLFLILQIQRVELEEELQRQKNRTADEIEAILQAHADEEEKLTQALRKEYESIASEKDAWDQVSAIHETDCSSALRMDESGAIVTSVCILF
jgi:hypothetical protein